MPLVVQALPEHNLFAVPVRAGTEMMQSLPHSEWYARERPEYRVETRPFGQIDGMFIRQPGGAFPDPAKDAFDLQIITGGATGGRFDLGDGVFSSTSIAGGVVLSAPQSDCDYQLDDEHDLVVMTLPAPSVRALLHESSSFFPGDFGGLHSMLWRDNAIRDFALTIWRAAKGDGLAPDLDPDAALMQLALMLAKRAEKGFTLKEQSWQLSPHIRRRVTDFIEAHLEEDLPLFRLAEVAELSPFHFARSFRHDLGDTPHQFVTRRRLRRAEELITKTRTPLAEVALACGYASQQRLNDAFARELGTTPGRMRSEATR